MTALPEKARDDLGKILGLLESEHAGERDAAVCAATRLLERHGLRWCEVLSAASVTVIPQTGPRWEEPPRPDPTDPPGGGSWRDIAARCGQFPQHLDEWESQFTEGLGRFPKLSPKQYSKLSAIVRRLRAMGCKI
jgi:hypothetical protein